MQQSQPSILPPNLTPLNGKVFTFVVDDEARHSEFKKCRRFVGELVSNKKNIRYHRSLTSALKKIASVAKAPQIEMLLVFLDLRFPAREELRIDLFARRVKRIAEDCNKKLGLVILTNYPGESENIESDLVISKLELSLEPDERELELRAKVLKLLKRESIKCGTVEYPLRRSISEDDAAKIKKLLPASLARGARPRIMFHYIFQRLVRTPPNEMNSKEAAVWTMLLDILDLKAYEELNPPVSSRIGKLTHLTLKKVRIRWFGGKEEHFAFDEFPPEIAAASVGDTISVEFRQLPNQEINWISCTVSPPLRPTEEVLESDGSRIEGYEGLPVGDWPRK